MLMVFHRFSKPMALIKEEAGGHEHVTRIKATVVGFFFRGGASGTSMVPPPIAILAGIGGGKLQDDIFESIFAEIRIWSRSL